MRCHSGSEPATRTQVQASNPLSRSFWQQKAEAAKKAPASGRRPASGGPHDAPMFRG